jgi:hypothetical protein
MCTPCTAETCTGGAEAAPDGEDCRCFERRMLCDCMQRGGGAGATAALRRALASTAEGDRAELRERLARRQGAAERPSLMQKLRANVFCPAER